MSFFELLFALLLVCVLVGIVVVVHGVGTAARRAEAQARELAEVRGQLALSSQARDSSAVEVREVRDRLGQTTALLEGMRAAVSSRQQVEDDARQSLRRLEAVIAGSSTRGAAGENILEESFRHLPPDMLQRNLWVNGKVCEFGFRLPGGKVLAVDSKWTSSAGLEELALPETSPTRRSQLAAAIEKEVERRVREVSQYIQPDTTAPFAVAAVPDGAFALCRAAFTEAHRRHVVIVGYSLAVPYLLTLFQLHLQFSRTVDMENLQACLMEVDRQLDGLESTLENKLQRAVTMLGNTYTDGRQSVARMRASVHSIQVSEHLDGKPSLAVVGDAEPALQAAHRP
jgi:DNA recombination protein RmuC